MKVITLHTPVAVNSLYNHLLQKLVPLFRERRKENFDLQIEKNGDTIEISQPGLYEGVLFWLKVAGSEIQITRNEHYVDDVNSLTIESILNVLFEDMTNDARGVDLVTEG